MSFPLSIRPWPTKAKSEDSLEGFIKRIYEERGHFKNITEESLQKDIDTNDQEAVDLGSNAVEEKQQDVDGRRKELYAARTEMIKLVGQAQNEALTALDFISLLISKDAPKQADLSMSPFLKDTIPTGTLVFNRVNPPKPSKTDEEEAKRVAAGWNLQKLNSAADKLLDSATRLEKEMEKEARYWEQILSVSEQGWSICKMPREGHTIGVRFGFSEASPIFGTRGLAALRPDSDGNIVLDQGLSNHVKCIRVRLARAGVIVDTSSLPVPLLGSEVNLEKRIRLARDSLFEEELYQEMIREARVLMSYGVEVIDNEIRFAASQQEFMSGDSALEMIIDQVIATEHVKGQAQADSDSGSLAEGIALALRILLTHVYRHKFSVRSRNPTPLSSDKRLAPVQEILQPLISYFRHSQAIASLRLSLERLTQTLRAAKLDATYSIHNSESKPLTPISMPIAKVQSLVTSLTAHLNTTLKLNLPGRDSVFIMVVTRLSAPNYGTTFQLKLDSITELPSHTPVAMFSNFAEFHDQLIDVVRDSIVAYIAQQNPAWLHDPGERYLGRKDDTRIKRLRVVIQNERLGLLSESLGELPVMVALWQHTKDSTQQKGLTDVVDAL